MREASTRYVLLLSAYILVAAVCCPGFQTEKELSAAFSAAQDKNTVEAYRGFLEKYPAAPFADRAKEHIAELEAHKALAENKVFAALCRDDLDATDRGMFKDDEGKLTTSLVIYSILQDGQVGEIQYTMVNVDRRFVKANPACFVGRDEAGRLRVYLLNRGIKPEGMSSAVAFQMTGGGIASLKDSEGLLRMLHKLTRVEDLAKRAAAPEEKSK
jgi:hypothetical protein